MAELKRLLQVRKTIKSKKPDFFQQDSHKRKRLAKKWRRPTGIQSKMRHQFRGYARRVKQGWRSPVEIRGFHRLGLKPVMINNVAELSSIKNTEVEGIIISKNVGARKKLLIMAKAAELKIKILNIKPEQFKEKVAKAKAEISEKKKQKGEQKKKTLEESLKKAEKEKKDKEKLAKSEEKTEEAEEDKKIEEKKEKDNVLIHQQ